MDKVIGFIGCGNMARAIIKGIIESDLITKENIIASAKTSHTLEKVRKEYGIKTTFSNIEVAKASDILVLAIKPDIYDSILDEVNEYIDNKSIVVGIAAGISIGYMQKRLGRKLKVIRAMPNTPTMVGEGMTGISLSREVEEGELAEIIEIFNSLGRTEVIEERLMDAITAVSGSSPAYVYMMIEAMADGAVLEGMDRKLAYRFAAQAVLGAAKMVLETEIHPGELKDNVCSPGGTTIEAVSTLEEYGFRGTIIGAMRTCAKKSREMTR
ncbi:MAG TPA: pyrroline-5-carboxylate reductase, partial [Tepidimicrobium sp.]|nr:pyrroline-5-carboxylate reductase [Tepidimicrobium sp.]